MLKFLLLAVLVLWLLYSPGVRRLVRGLRADEPDSDAPAPTRRAPAPPQPLTMVPCARCGIHLPSSEALVDDAGRPFCSEAHRRAGPRQS